MVGSEDFYWFTIYASPADGIHEMSEDEILKYGMLTQPIMESSTDKIPGVLANKIETSGNPEADIVIVYAQHGPMLDILGWNFSVYFPDVDKDQVYLVSVHQTQTYAPYKFKDAPISSDDAQSADETSVQYLADIVQFYLDKGRTVHVVGKSFGAYLVQELLATQGNVADGYLLIAGRLDMQEEAAKQFADGQGIKFENGVTPVPDPEYASDEEGECSGENMARLLGAVAVNRYTERLADVPMDNVIYVYGKQDDHMGGLTTAEVAFLEGKGVTVLAGEDGYRQAAKELMEEGMKLLIGEAYME
jgi:pimeloyl-ACP methyl ester carboxylesterase